MNDRVAIFQAMALQEVANNLHASFNSMSDPTRKLINLRMKGRNVSSGMRSLSLC